MSDRSLQTVEIGDKRNSVHSGPGRGSAAVIQSRNVWCGQGTAIASNGDKQLMHRQHGRDQMCQQTTHTGVLLF